MFAYLRRVSGGSNIAREGVYGVYIKWSKVGKVLVKKADCVKEVFACNGPSLRLQHVLEEERGSLFALGSDHKINRKAPLENSFFDRGERACAVLQ
jgi:hypothetical protein